MRAFIASALLLTSMLSVLPDLAYAQFEPMDPLHVRADVTRTGWRSKYDQYIVNLLTKGDVGTDQEWAEVCVEAGDNPYGIPSHHVNVAVASCDVGVPYGDICANRAYCRPPCSTILDRWSGVCGCPQGHILNYETRECIPDPCTELPSEWIELAVTSEIGQCHNYKDRIIVPDDPELLCQQYIVDTSVDEQNRCWVYVDYEVRGDYDDIMNPGGDDPGGDDPGGDDPGGDDPGGDDPGGDDPGGDDPGGDDPGGDDPGGDDPGGDDPGGDDPGGDDPGGDDPGGD
ncbi:hypothetical protein, partial [Marichromatium sp. AB32]|uniref:hypothetical protein n=1 Tax=Marichromatium sp. AB32 TaxID=2483363 RepID=UPI00168004ED